MAALGGSLESMSINGREFPVAADAEAQRSLGGFEIEVEANGDGSARIIKTRMPLSIEGVTVEIDDDRGDHEFLQDVSEINDFVPVSLTYASGITYQGTAQLVGEMKASSKNATMPLSLKGPGRLERQ